MIRKYLERRITEVKILRGNIDTLNQQQGTGFSGAVYGLELGTINQALAELDELEAELKDYQRQGKAITATTCKCGYVHNVKHGCPICLKAENDSLKKFEDYSVYVGGELAVGKRPMKYSQWIYAIGVI